MTILKTIKEESVDCTVILCCKNAEKSIALCLESILLNNPRELIVIDGLSTDRTIEIISSYGVTAHQGLGKGLTSDRQYGIELSTSKWSFFIDSDHVLPKNFLLDMKNLIEEHDYILLQSKLEIWKPKGLLNKGENSYYEIVHNAIKEEIIPGIAPAIFQTDLLKSTQPLAIDDGMTATIDDTNWAIRAIQKGAKIGIRGPKVSQIHSGSVVDYYKKFKWYGIGDGEFCQAQPEHRKGHYFHLLIRYPFIYSLRSFTKSSHRAIPFLIMQGIVRGFWCTITDVKIHFVRSQADE